MEVNETAPKYDIQKRYTYTDYMTWGEDVRCELIDGVVYDMSPAPGWIHQGISGKLVAQLSNFLEGKSCMVFQGPFDVRLNIDEGDNTVVQPDVVVICDRSIMAKTGCNGAPDMVVEVLSPSNASKDFILKRSKYMHAGVRELWIIDPESRIVQVYVREDGKYNAIDYLNAGKIPVSILDGCEIDMARIFADIDAFDAGDSDEKGIS